MPRTYKIIQGKEDYYINNPTRTLGLYNIFLNLSSLIEEIPLLYLKINSSCVN
nr:MAG TPA: hypothetical protein [Caudoviricetes sp.]